MTTIDYSKFEGHTPGPWPIAYVSGAIRHLVRNCDADCFLSGEEWSSMNVAGFYGWDKYKDSPLIAAAPTLLARCKALEEENARLHERLQRLEREKDARLARAALAANKEKT